MFSCHLSGVITEEPYWYPSHTSCLPLMWFHILIWKIWYSYQTFITPQNCETTLGDTYFLKNTTIKQLLPWCSCSCIKWLADRHIMLNEHVKSEDDWLTEVPIQFSKSKLEERVSGTVCLESYHSSCYTLNPHDWSFFLLRLLSLKFMNMYNDNGADRCFDF